jgi:hypothetical protein
MHLLRFRRVVRKSEDIFVHAMKAFIKEVWLHTFFTSAIDRYEWLSSCLGSFISKASVYTIH